MGLAYLGHQGLCLGGNAPARRDVCRRTRVRAASDPLPEAGVGRVLIRVREKETQTAGGIFLASSASNKTSQGVVVSVGPGKLMTNGEREDTGGVQVGDNVLFDEVGHWKVQLNGESYVVARFRNICAQWK